MNRPRAAALDGQRPAVRGVRHPLFVDGTAIGAADVPGSVSRNAPFGVHVGQRMDGRAFFTGAIDDVRVWDRALTDEEIKAGSALAGNAVVWLPMDHVGNSR